MRVANEEQIKWAKKLKRLLKTMPIGIEIIVGRGTIHVMEEGFYRREIFGTDVDMMCGGETVIMNAALIELDTDPSRVLPNSESI